MIPVRRLTAPLSPSEAEALAALYAIAFDEPNTRGWSAEEVATLASAPGAILLTAGDTGAPIGLALARVAADEAELLTIATAPSARRRGVGAALLTRMRAALHEAGVARLFLEVRASNTAAAALYSTSGFQQVARRESYYPNSGGGREDALIYKLEVN